MSFGPIGTTIGHSTHEASYHGRECPIMGRRQVTACRSVEHPSDIHRILLSAVTSFGEYPVAGMVLPMWLYFFSVRLRVPW